MNASWSLPDTVIAAIIDTANGGCVAGTVNVTHVTFADDRALIMRRPMAGSFAQNGIRPHLKNCDTLGSRSVMTATGCDGTKLKRGCAQAEASSSWKAS